MQLPNLCTIWIIVKLWFSGCDKSEPNLTVKDLTVNDSQNCPTVFSEEVLKILYALSLCSHNIRQRGENSLHIYSTGHLSQLIKKPLNKWEVQRGKVTCPTSLCQWIENGKSFRQEVQNIFPYTKAASVLELEKLS